MPTAAEKFSASIEAIKDAIALIAGTAAPLALIMKRFVFDEIGDNWAAMLRSPADLDSNGDQRVNAIQIWFEGLDQEDEEPIASVNPLLPFGFAFFYQYDAGTDADNSEKRLMKQIAEVMWALEVSTDLGMNEALDANVRGSVMGHEGLRVPRIGVKPLGATPVHVAVGRFEVRMQSRYVRA
jgi:hypothetical protein